ncbi:hypothetical protein Dsin_000455 [Dipteronia sinensis]|uniref:SKP1 component POZ domain-containing protein n=1 Tax=Dipteronia sinensis TaxID=43782 RepID=A0AAE0B3P5_9ROSI|nr:hypothetical protein Dsin_000455 [Dipteronia sinensis]
MASTSSLTQEKKITLKAADGKLFEVEEAVAMEMGTVKSFFIDNENMTYDWVVPLQNVSAEHMLAIIDFYRMHLEFRQRIPLPPAEEVKAFDAAFLEKKKQRSA